MNKYRAKKCECDGITFDSILERNVYLSLLLAFSRDQIKVHHSVLLAKKNQYFSDWHWKVDFYIPHLDLYIEAKGEQTEAFRVKLHAVSILQPEIIDRLIMVTAKGGEYVCKGVKAKSLAEMNGLFRDIAIGRNLREFKEKEQCR